MNTLINKAFGRIALKLGVPANALIAVLLFFCALHQAVTSFRLDRGWSQDIPAFALCGLAGLCAATIIAILRKNPLPEIRAILAGLVITFTFGFFSGKIPPSALVGQIGRPPELLYWYFAAAGVVTAVAATIIPRRPLEGFLFVALAFATPATRYLLRWAPEGFEVAPICIALAALAQDEFSRDGEFRWPPLAMPALAFLGSVFVSSVFSSQQQTAWPAFGRTGLQVAAFIAVICYFRRESRGRVFVNLMAAVAFVVAAAELFMFERFTRLVGLPSARLCRLEPFGIHPNLTAPFSMVGALACAGAILCARGFTGRGLAFIAFVVCALSLYLHKSGGATMGLAAGLGCMAVAWAAVKFRSRIITNLSTASLIVAPVAAVVAAILIPIFTPQLKGGGESGKINVATRVEFWPAATKAMLANPVTGLGPRNVEVHAIYVKENVEANIDWSNHPHNILLEIGETLGITGLVIFLALLGAAGLAARRTFLAKDTESGGDSYITIAGLGILSALIADGFVDHGFAEFAVLSDAMWIGLAWIAIGSVKSPAAAPANAMMQQFARPALALGTLVLAILGAAVPLVVSELEQSIKWLQFWNTNSAKYETFRDVDGQFQRMDALLQLSPSRSDIRLLYANVLIAKEPSPGSDRESLLREATAHVERAVNDSPYTSEVLQNAAAFYANYIISNPEKHYQRALELYQRARVLGNPDERGRAWLGIARCQSALGKAAEGIEALANALQAIPNLPITTFGFKPYMEADGHRDFQYSPRTAEKISVHAAIKFGIDRLRPRLKDDFDTAWGPLARLAECYTIISRADLAIELYQEIESLAPSLRMNLPSALAQARIAAQQYDQALVDIDRAIHNKEWHPYMSALRARALEGLSKFTEMYDEAQKCYEAPSDVVAFRTQLRDSLTRLATAKQNTSQFIEATRFYTFAARCEDNPYDRVRLQMNACLTAARGYRLSQNAGFIVLLAESLQLAADWTGLMEWADLDRNKLTELGRDIGNACGDKARVVFNAAVDFIEKTQHPSPGLYWILYGMGGAAAEVTKKIEPNEVNDLMLRVSGMRRVALSLTARIHGIGSI